MRQMQVKSSERPIEVLIEKELCIEIVKSSYFKMLYQIRKHRHAINEIYNQVNHVEPWMIDDSLVTGLKVSVGPSITRIPSTAFCLLYHLFTMKLTEKQVHDLLDHPDSPYIRAIGFLYLRYVAAPDTLWTWYKDYIEHKEEFSPGPNGKMTTMGVYVRDVLLGEYYFGSPLPPVHPQILREVRTNLENMRLSTKLSGITSDPSVGKNKSPPRNHRSQSYERNHEARRSRSDRDHEARRSRSDRDHRRYSVREPCHANRETDYHWSNYSEWDAGRRSHERRDRGSDQNGHSSSRRRSRSRSRSRSGRRGPERSDKGPDRNGRSSGRRSRSRSRSRSGRRGPERSDKAPDRNGRSSGRRSRS